MCPWIQEGSHIFVVGWGMTLGSATALVTNHAVTMSCVDTKGNWSQPCHELVSESVKGLQRADASGELWSLAIKHLFPHRQSQQHGALALTAQSLQGLVPWQEETARILTCFLCH